MNTANSVGIDRGSHDWMPDDELAGFVMRKLEFKPDPEGPVIATVVRPKSHPARKRAVLYLHGFIDYFFQAHLAAAYESLGVDFYALDLRRYGRSLRAGEPYPNFCRQIEEYYEEIDAALDVIRTEGHDWVLLNGHSTGALLAARYAQDGPRRAQVNAVFLNSPFLEFNGLAQQLWARVVARIGKNKPYAKQDGAVSPWYGRSLHKDHYGEWQFSDARKPLDGFPAFYGWVRAIRLAQDAVVRGGITVPILVLHSSRSHRAGKHWDEAYKSADIVLDVEDMKRLSPGLGSHVTIRPIEGGMHDLILSRASARQEVIERLADWLKQITSVL